MYVPNYSSSAYQLDRYVEQKVDKKAEAEKKKQLKLKAARRKVVVYMLVFFTLMFAILFRYVQIYDLHSEAAQKTAELENLRMKNEQTRLTIENMTDKAKIQEYAETKLGLQKMTDAQIVYLNPHKGSCMMNVAKEAETDAGGTKGLFAGFLEYLK